MGAASYICTMFIRKNKNRSGSVSIQIIQKVGRKNKIIKSLGSSYTQREEELLVLLAKNEIERIEGMASLFVEREDLIIDAFVENIENTDLQVVGPQTIIGKLYEQIGYHKAISSELFKHLVIHRLVELGSKLKAVEYLGRHLNDKFSVYTIYRFLDKLNSDYKGIIEQTTFNHTRKILQGHIGVIFYDLTPLYFESTKEDELRIAGYSKDCKHQHPQIMIGLMVGQNGYPIGYEIFEGNKAETKTLLSVLESFEKKFNLERPIVVADAALLSQNNIDQLNAKGYQFILGGGIRNEENQIKGKILSLNIQENNPKEIKHNSGRLIITYSSKRQKKDYKNRAKGLERLKNKIKSGKLSKENINNRGYNKYLKLKGETTITIDYEKYNQDSSWDGLKGYLTNTELAIAEVNDDISIVLMKPEQKSER